MRVSRTLLFVATVLLSLLFAVGSVGGVASTPIRHVTSVTSSALPDTPTDINNMLAATPGPVTIGKFKLGPLVVDQPGPCLQPSSLPATLDRTMLSNAELLQYGLPPKPTKPSAIQAWAQAVRAAKHRTCAERASLDVSANTTANWAGNVVSGSGYSFTDLWANWNVPCLATNSPVGKSAVWEGLGSGSSNARPLVQAGTEQDVLTQQPWDDYYAWTENFPYQSSEQWQFAVGCGDNMYANSWSPNCSFIQDNRFGDNSRDVCTGPSADSSQGEWILEAPDYFGEQPLADFRYVVFTNTDDTSPGYGDTQPHYGVWMEKNGVYCAYPGAWNNDSFQVTWESSYC